MFTNLDIFDSCIRESMIVPQQPNCFFGFFDTGYLVIHRNRDRPGFQSINRKSSTSRHNKRSQQ